MVKEKITPEHLAYSKALMTTRPNTRLFLEDPDPEREVGAGLYKKAWYPMTYLDSVKTFVKGKGWVKPTRIEKMKMLPPTFEVKDVLESVAQWGIEVTLSRIRWRHDDFAADYRRVELYNLAQLPRYEEWFYKAWEIEKEFLIGMVDKYQLYIYEAGGGDRWYTQQLTDNKEDYKCAFRNDVSPMMFIDHILMGLMRVKPMFDPVEYEKALDNFLMSFDPDFEIMYEDDQEADRRCTVLANMSVADKMDRICGIEGLAARWQQVMIYDTYIENNPVTQPV